MKELILSKTGYSAGAYGCSAEYFSLAIIDGENFTAINFEGLYGAEHRVIEPLVQAGFKSRTLSTTYGRVTRKDKHPNTMSEYTALEYVKNYLAEEK